MFTNNKNNNLTYSIAYSQEVMQEKNKNYTEEIIVLQNFTTGDKEQIKLIRNSKEWYEYKVVEVAQKVALAQKNNKKNKHFHITDLESYLVEEGFKVLVKFDYNQHKYFEAYLRRCFAKKVFTFFTETEIDKNSDFFTTLMPVGNEENEERNNIDIPVDIWEELHNEMELEDLLNELDEDERFLAVRLLEGFKATDVARELNTYKEKTRRTHLKVKEKFSHLQRPRKTSTTRTVLMSTTSVQAKQQRDDYLAMRKQLDDNNKDLHATILAWAKDRKKD